MMEDFIKEYIKEGLIKKETIGFDQVVKHINRAQKDLKVAEANLDIDAEASYNYAYLSMLRASRALMFSYGYRPADGQQHKTVVIFSKYILTSDFSKLVRHFNRMRQKRNRFTYDEPGLLVSRTETEESFKSAKQFVRQITEFIQRKNPRQKLV
ncbi:HEPN domain-containing protein [Patescibacteria group bacterium]|nr:HEPN domain-containing protein [Patescibacteria group bacterium]